jgi:N-dimethylarginine dimethylaminohydrolase
MPILMCPPTHYGVEYEINPWMHVEVPVDRVLARQQWEALRRTYAELGVEVILAEAWEGLPDMVFTANAALVHGDRAVLSHFRYPERQGEEARWRALFEGWGMRVADTGGIPFEGAGDGLFVAGVLFCGHGFRSDAEAIPRVARALDVEAVPLELIDERFYHLDTCFCPIDEQTALVAPEAFSAESLRRIRSRVERVIEVPTEVAAGFACNAIRVDGTVVSSTAAEALAGPLGEAGCRIVGLPMSEFMKAGGGVRCLSLPGIPGRVPAPASPSGSGR